MFVSKTLHNALLNERSERIAALESEVAFLRSMVEGLTVAKPMRREAENAAIEANAVLSGAQDQIDLNDLSPEQLSVLSERDAILNGHY